MTIILQESLRGLFYAPYYAALALGAYKKEGVAVRFAAAPGFGNAPNGLFDGSTDAAWGGPMRVNQLYQERGDCDLVCFGEAVTRDPFLLIGREPRPNFAMTDLTCVRLATVSEVPTPWLCLQHDLRLAGIDPARLDRIAGGTMADNMAALRAGAVDVVQLFEAARRGIARRGRGAFMVRGGGARAVLLHHLLRAPRHAGGQARRISGAGARPLSHPEMAVCATHRGPGRNHGKLFSGSAASPPRRSGAGALQKRSVFPWGRNPVLPARRLRAIGRTASFPGRFLPGASITSDRRRQQPRSQRRRCAPTRRRACLERDHGDGSLQAADSITEPVEGGRSHLHITESHPRSHTFSGRAGIGASIRWQMSLMFSALEQVRHPGAR